ncbi:substrate-binding periplasmic protein [Pseudoalteromonas aurantia]|uniref:Polar amino acid transport system substrate-binding protein n=1 Tax=Pseudoalteromonas aurantia 208 TaxID=1314867 RepID=A0ABR9EAU5_9GAMM|nr:transporter substrate-binding domain-containing protein [Pseudoalteromonas aurantia]MBE0368115.1 polar amino acid transport system substrate-binding protein [Pseudoalteromonas aurantia 208]
MTTKRQFLHSYHQYRNTQLSQIDRADLYLSIISQLSLAMYRIRLILLLIAPWYLAALVPSIRVVTEDLPPYQIVKDTRIVAGSSFQIVKRALSIAGYQQNIEVLPWARAYKIAQTQPNTLIFSIAKTPERAPLFHWLYKLQPLQYQFYSSTKHSTVTIGNIDDAKSLIAVSVRGSYEANALREMGFKENQNLLIVGNFTAAWRSLEMGRADIMWASHIPANALVNSQYGYFPHEHVIKHHELYVALSLNTPEPVVTKLKNAFIEASHELNNHQ